jgi:hypothetical protein
MRRQIHHVMLGCVFGLCLGTLVHAQTTGSVRGTVKDAGGAVVPHATVIMMNRATRAQRDTVTDDQGVYAFAVVPVGQYDLEITFPGFLVYRRPGLSIDVNSAIQMDAVLQIAGQNESITVNAEAVRIETAQTALGETITSQHVAVLPLNGRSYTDLLSIQAGVTPINTSATQNQSSGGAFGANSVDGNINSPTFGAIVNAAPPRIGQVAMKVRF